MDRPDAIEVEIEFVFDDTKSSGHVIARRLELPGPAFRVTPESTIGGCPIKSLRVATTRRAAGWFATIGPFGVPPRKPIGLRTPLTGPACCG